VSRADIRGANQSCDFHPRQLTGLVHKMLGRRVLLKDFTMANPNEERRDQARRKAQNHFAASEQRDALVRKELEKERSQHAAKTAKLRALRLAKEAVDKEAAARLAAEPAELKAKKPRAPRMKRAPGH